MITPRLEQLARAMAQFEGWKPGGSSDGLHSNGTVAYRNHNPGNLRASIFALGERDEFAFFYNDATGFFAMLYDLMMKCQGKTVTNLTPDSTIAELIGVYSASSGDELENYISHVERMTNFSRSTAIGTLLDY